MSIVLPDILAEPFEQQLERVKQHVPFDAYLFGSRSKISVQDSDWDFAAEYTEENHQKLVDAGYEFLGTKDTLEKSDYCDTLSHSFYYKEVDGAEINVILKTDMNLFEKVWERISEQFFVDFIWKQGPFFISKGHITQLMDQLFEVAR